MVWGGETIIFPFWNGKYCLTSITSHIYLWTSIFTKLWIYVLMFFLIEWNFGVRQLLPFSIRVKIVYHNSHHLGADICSQTVDNNVYKLWIYVCIFLFVWKIWCKVVTQSLSFSKSRKIVSYNSCHTPSVGICSQIVNINFYKL